MNRELFDQARLAATELCVKANLKPGDIMVIGCSSSEVAGGVIGHNSSLETAEAVFKGIYEALTDCGVYLAAQCCCREVEQKVIYQAVIIANEGVVRLFLNKHLNVAIDSLVTSGIALARHVDYHSLSNTCRDGNLDNLFALDDA